jgi:hypothetical protein
MFSYATKSDGVQPTASDPNFNQVSVLLHGDGTNGAQNNTFLDSSTNNFTITRNGNTTQGTNTPFSQAAGYWSNYFDGANDRLTIADNANLRAGTSSFTLEAWVYRNVAGVAHTIFAKGAATPTGFVFGITSSNTLRFTDTSTNIDSTGTIPANTWTYVAVVREGTGSNQLKLYINGTNDGTGTSSTDFNQTTEARIGENRGATEDFNGYISNLRFVIGTAVYTSNFTPSTTPITAITNTRLLTCQSNRFVDNSSNNFTLTATGTPSSQPWSPFAPTSAYSTSVNGGSMYFDGTGDYLSIADNAALEFGSSNFTLEFWCYWNGNTASQILWTKGADLGSAYAPFLFWKPTGSSLILYASSAGTSWDIASNVTLATMDANQWSHFAFVRNGNTIKFYKNGVEQTSITTALAFWNNTLAMTIGSGAVGNVPFINGYISNARIIIGTALYTANFTPPTAPLTAITNTSLLLSGTNAGIFDNAIKNNLETVGNAQISTSVTKFGTGSISFDGTGDWLTSPDSVNLQFGTGKFTIEGWVYLNAIGSARGFVSKGTSTTGWSLGTTALNQVIFNYDSSSITSTGVLLISTWYFVTVVREGTGTNQTKIYINGTNDGTGTVSSNFNQTNILYVGANRVGGSALNGYIDDLRITNGVARYTANFTPPTAAFSNL